MFDFMRPWRKEVSSFLHDETNIPRDYMYIHDVALLLFSYTPLWPCDMKFLQQTSPWTDGAFISLLNQSQSNWPNTTVGTSWIGFSAMWQI